MHNTCISCVSMTNPRCTQNNEWYVPYLKMNESEKRAIVTTTVLKLIETAISSQADGNSQLQEHLERLDSYVELVSKSLNK